jgi:flagellin
VRINTNVNAINAQRNLNTVGLSLSKSIERLSSGLRINRAGDDAAGLSISEKLRGQVKGLNQAVRNAQDGISLIQTAEGGLNETHSILQRMRELAIQASNDTLTTDDRGAIAAELTALNDEIDRIADNTQFNTKNVLNGSLSTVMSTDDTGATDTDSSVRQGDLVVAGVVLSKIDVSGAKAGTFFQIDAGTTATRLKITAFNGVDNTGPIVGSQEVDVAAMVAATDPSEQVLDFNQLGIKLTLNGLNAAGTAAGLVTSLAAESIFTDVGNASAAFQVGANANQTVSVAINSANATKIGNAGPHASLDAAVAAFAGAKTTVVAQQLIANLDKAIADVSGNRSALGAVQNRLEHTIENLATSSENLAASESRIRDADMAAEMVGFTRSNILSQAGTSILAQANQLPQGVLSLLR